MSHTLLAAFTDRKSADNAIASLENGGFEAKDLSIITKDTKVESGSTLAGNVADGTASGAVTGGVIGGAAGLLVGAGVIPALAGLLIGGPIAVALGATGLAAATISGVVTGAVAGSLIGALTGLGVPEEDAKYFDETVKEGGVLVAVAVDQDGEEARTILEKHHGGRIISLKAKDQTSAM